MDYQFPHIKHLDDVLPAIEGRDEFVVAQREGYKIICYVVALPDTFPPVNTVRFVQNFDVSEPVFESKEDHYAAIRRECRGMIFCAETGRILRRPLTKFFNVGERDETQIHQLDFTQDHKVYTKLDGSMISPFEVGYRSGVIRWGTKMGLSEVALKAEVFVARNPKYMDFSKWCISNDITPVFEYTAPDNRIVVKYEEPQLTLLAARHMITGKYIDLH